MYACLCGIYTETQYIALLRLGQRTKRRKEPLPQEIAQTESACSNLAPKGKQQSESDANILMWTYSQSPFGSLQNAHRAGTGIKAISSTPDNGVGLLRKCFLTPVVYVVYVFALFNVNFSLWKHSTCFYLTSLYFHFLICIMRMWIICVLWRYYKELVECYR